MNNVLDIRGILIYGSKKDLTILEEALNENFNDVIEEIFTFLKSMFNNYEYDDRELLSCFKNLNYLISQILNIRTREIILDKYRDLIKFLSKNNCNEKYIKISTKALNKYTKCEEDKNIKYELLKYVVFELKDLSLISKMLYDSNSLIYDYECNMLIYDVIKCLITSKEAEKYYERLTKLLLVFKNSLINNDNKDKIYNLLSNHKKNSKIKFIYQYLDIDLLEHFDAEARFNRKKDFFEYQLDDYGRYDFTDQYVITIDDADALCLDDAVSCTFNKDGTYTLYIHITDIYDIISKNLYLDNWAYNLGETIYLKDRNIYLFPKEISDNIASLLHNKKRNVITYMIKLDSNLDFAYDKLEDYFKIVKGVIINKAKLSYQSVDDILIRGCNNEKLVIMLNKLSNIAYKLRSNNQRKEEYHKLQNNKMSQFGITAPVESKYIDIYTGANIVQELMILVNRLLPELFNNRNLPFLYRVCDKEIETRVDDHLNSLCEYAQNNDISSGVFKYKKFVNLASSISPAKYSADKAKHLGLGLDYYSHSTSPARRYADVVNQKLTYDLLFNQKLGDDNLDNWYCYIKQVAEHLNYKEEFNEALAISYHRKLRKK